MAKWSDLVSHEQNLWCLLEKEFDELPTLGCTVFIDGRARRGTIRDVIDAAVMEIREVSLKPCC